LKSPFNERKYRSLLEGLEVSEVMLSEAMSITGEVRWDSEYYQKTFLINEKTLKKHKTKRFGELCNFIKKGIFDLPPSNYIEKGVPLIRTSEVKNPTIDFSTTVYISDEINKNNYLNPYRKIANSLYHKDIRNK